jgi:hypothetical protein
VHFERLLAERVQNILSIIQHEYSAARITRIGTFVEDTQIG